MKRLSQKLREIKTEDWIIRGFCLFLALLFLSMYLATPRAHIKVYYDREAEELVIVPKFLYTLEGYSFGYDPWQYTYVVHEETLLPLSTQTDREYRFQGVPGTKDAGMDVLISYRNILTGKRLETWLHTERRNSETTIVVSGYSGGKYLNVAFEVEQDK